MAFTRIESPRNEKVRYARKLHRRGFRRREGRFLVEGPRLILEGISSGLPFVFFLFSPESFSPSDWPEVARALGEVAPAYEVPAAVLELAAGTETPQGILAVAEKPVFSPEEALSSSGPLLVLDGVGDPGNLGALVRAAEGLGAAGVILGEGTVDPYNPKVVRAAMGSLFRLPVVEVGLESFLRKEREKGRQVLVAVPRGGRDPWELDLSGDPVLVLGSEPRGVRPEVMSLGSGLISVPLAEPVESLNVALAGGVLLYEARRQRLHRERGGVSG